MNVTVALFAGAREIVGQSSLKIQLNQAVPVTVEHLRNEMQQAFPELKPILAHSLFAIDHEFATPQQLITAESDVALIPPVSGG